MIDTWTILTFNQLNITKDELTEIPTHFIGPYCPKCVLKWSRSICLGESDREDNVTQQQQILLPYPDYSDRDLEKLKTETEDELD